MTGTFLVSAPGQTAVISAAEAAQIAVTATAEAEMLFFDNGGTPIEAAITPAPLAEIVLVAGEKGDPGPPGPEGPEGPAGPSDWAAITGKPAAFPPSTHTHAQSDVTGLVTALAGKEASGTAASLIAAHEAAADPHPGYVTTAEGAALISSHEAAGDPHPQYLTAAEGTAAFAARAWTAYTATLGDGKGLFDFEATVTDVACTALSVVEVRLAATADTDENEPEFTSLWSATAHPAAGSFLLTLAFAELHAGPLKLQYRIN